jgi:hypothetical protein
MRNAYKILKSETLKGGDYLGNLDVDGRVILNVSEGNVDWIHMV